MKSNPASYGLLIVGVAIAAEYVWHGRQVADLRREIAALHEAPPEARTPSRVPLSGSSAESRPARPVPVEIVHAVPAAPAPAPREDGSESSEAEKNARWKEEERAHQTAVEAGFAAEAVDREWAHGARRDLQDHVAALLPPSSSVREVDCRSSMCRVELVVADGAASQHFMQSAFLSADQHIWNGPGFVEPAQANPDGSVGVVVYLAREGASFPE